MCEMFSEVINFATNNIYTYIYIRFGFQDLPPKKFSNYFTKLCTFLCFARANEENRGFCNPNESITYNNSEFITINANRSSSASTLNKDVVVDFENALNSRNSKAPLELAKGEQETVSGKFYCDLTRNMVI